MYKDLSNKISVTLSLRYINYIIRMFAVLNSRLRLIQVGNKVLVLVLVVGTISFLQTIQTNHTTQTSHSKHLKHLKLFKLSKPFKQIKLLYNLNNLSISKNTVLRSTVFWRLTKIYVFLYLPGECPSDIF